MEDLILINLTDKVIFIEKPGETVTTLPLSGFVATIQQGHATEDYRIEGVPVMRTSYMGVTGLPPVTNPKAVYIVTPDVLRMLQAMSNTPGALAYVTPDVDWSCWVRGTEAIFVRRFRK